MLGPGDTIGSYEVLAPLSSGGMGNVLLARRRSVTGLAKMVAIKAIAEQLSGDIQAVQRFLDEARVTATIDHPNVARVDELLEADGDFYLVLEYVHGCSVATLGERLAGRKRRLAAEVAGHVASNVALGLHAAHETRGPDGRSLEIIHRDVSPQNVLLSHRGDVKLIDFGVAKSLGRNWRTQVGHVLGKLAYMAPEQLAGRPLDRRADVYALGVVLWELLTLRTLFWVPDNPRSLKSIKRQEVEPPSRYVQTIPEALDAVVLAALDPDPEGRPATALELHERLLAAVPGAAVIDATQVATIVHTMLDAELEKELHALPQEISTWLRSQSLELELAHDADTLTRPGPSGATPLLELERDDTDVQPMPPAVVEDDEPTVADRRIPASVSERAPPVPAAMPRVPGATTQRGRVPRLPVIIAALSSAAAIGLLASMLVDDDAPAEADGRVEGAEVAPPAPPARAPDPSEPIVVEPAAPITPAAAPRVEPPPPSAVTEAERVDRPSVQQAAIRKRRPRARPPTTSERSGRMRAPRRPTIGEVDGVPLVDGLDLGN